MTIYEAEEFLKGYLKSKRRYQSIMLDVEELETQIAGLSVDYTRIKVQSTPKDKLANAIDRLNYLHKECIRIADEATRNMEQVFWTINRVEDESLRELLTRKYIAGQTWEQIAVEMGFNDRYIYKLKRSALEGIAENEQSG